MKIVIISHNQETFLLDMYKTVNEFDYVFVLDRCSDNSVQICEQNNINYITNQKGTGFLAGYSRQLGVKHFGTNEDILFLDGDKIPMGDLVQLEMLSKSYDCVLLETKLDDRKYERNTILVFDKANPHNCVYSCGIVLSSNLMNECSKFSCCGRVWHEDFDGYWGEEDRWIGDVAIYNDMKIVFSDVVVLSGKIGGMDGKEDQLGKNVLKRLALRRKLGYVF